MPDKSTIRRARNDARRGKSPSTQAGEFVKDEVDKVRSGKHVVRSAKQAIAIGLSEARRSGIKLPPAPGTRVKKSASVALSALKREPTSTVSQSALSKQAKDSAAKRGPARLRAAAKKAVHTRQLVAR